MRISAGFSGPIVSAVAGEVVRLDQHPDFWKCEGGAYKAAWDRLKPLDSKAPGSPALNLCEAHRRDCQLAALAAAHPGTLRVLIASAPSMLFERRGNMGRFNPHAGAPL
jgi:hypothetical protein